MMPDNTLESFESVPDKYMHAKKKGLEIAQRGGERLIVYNKPPKKNGVKSNVSSIQTNGTSAGAYRSLN